MTKIKKKRFRKRFLVGILLAFFLILTVYNSYSSDNYYQKERDFKDKSNVLRNSGNSEPIYISNDNWSGLTGIQGDGSYSNPWIIEDLIIDGSGSGTCIKIYSSNDFFRIENCTFSNSSNGVYLSSVNNGTLHNNTFYDITGNMIEGTGMYGFPASNLNITKNHFVNISGSYYGIQLFSYNDSIISKNMLKSNTYRCSGIHIWDSEGLKIIENKVNNCGSGIELNQVGNIYIYNNSFNCGVYGISIGRDRGNNEIIFNNMTDCGLNFYQSEKAAMTSNFIPYNNSVNGKHLYYYINKSSLHSNPTNFENSGQIILVNCNNTVLSDKIGYDITIENTSKAISIFYGKNNTFNSLSVSNNGEGISLYKSENTTISKINATFNDYAIYSYNSINTNISYNNLYNNRYGIAFFSNSNNNTVFKNVLNDNFFGLGLYSSKYLDLAYNNFSKCGLSLTADEKDLVTLNISTTNLVNDRSVYYYKNQEDLRNANFTFKGLPGQIILVGCNDSELSDFKFTQASIGIQTFYSENMTFSNITVERSFMGLYLERTNYTKINDFYSFNNTRGIQIQDCNSNNIIDSNFSLCLEEQMYYINPTILLRFSDQNRIDNCNIDFSKCALRLESSESNEIKMNKFFQNEEGVILDLQSRNNLIHLNNFIENEIQSLDDGSNNAWDNGELGNYWDDYSGFDISPEDGIGDVNYTISGQSYSNDTFPIVYPTYDDTDGDGLKNLEEYTDGIDTYKTNVTNSDSDFDYLSDYLEWIYSTNPWDNDTDDDLMLDGWEVSNQLNPTINDSFEDLDDDGLTNLEEYNLGTKANTNDTDSDLMLDAWEVSNGLNPNTNDTSEDLDNDGLTNLEEFNLGTLPNNFDSDNDGFSDGIEVSLGTNALNIELYPKPDLSISKFNCTNENLTLTISNTGIWNATDIIVYILIPSLNLTLYNNSATPFNLTVKQNYTISINFVDFEEWLEEGESYNLSIIIDPDNRINEINELDNLESNIDFEYQLTNEETPNLFLFTMILTILAVSIPSLGASYYFVRKKGLFGFEGKDKLREEKLSEAPQKQIPTKTFPKASEIRKKKKPISRLTMEDLGGSKELTEERLEEMARTESEMELEDYKIICVVHKGEVTGNVYVCPNCKSFYCDRCAKVLKLKGESCWYCKADITLQLKDTDRLLLLEKRASALIEEILNENSEIETYINGEKNIGEFPELKSQFFFLFNPEKLDNIDLLDLTINEKKRFIKEILNLSMEERDELIAKMLELKG